MAEHRVLGVIPARSGSKGIPNKNIRMLKGKPLIHWAANALMNAKMPHTRICSTDSEEIAEIVKQTGIEVPWLRPRELATDTSSTVDVLYHALKRYREKNAEFTHVVLVQPTSPTVLSTDIDAAISLAVEKDADTVISGFHTYHAHPSLMYTLDDSDQVTWMFAEEERKSRRQEFSTVFVRTGLIYLARADLILNRHTIYGERILSITIPESRAITIDEEYDFRIAEFMLEEMNHG